MSKLSWSIAGYAIYFLLASICIVAALCVYRADAYVNASIKAQWLLTLPFWILANQALTGLIWLGLAVIACLAHLLRVRHLSKLQLFYRLSTNLKYSHGLLLMSFFCVMALIPKNSSGYHLLDVQNIELHILGLFIIIFCIELFVLFRTYFSIRSQLQGRRKASHDIQRVHQQLAQLIHQLHKYANLTVQKVLEKRNWIDEGFEISRKNFRSLDIDGYKPWVVGVDEIATLNIKKTIQKGLDMRQFSDWAASGRATQLSYEVKTNAEMMVFFCMAYRSVTETSFMFADKDWRRKLCSHVGYQMLWFELMRKILHGYEYTVHAPNINVTEKMPYFDQGAGRLKLANVLAAEYSARHKNHHRLAEKMRMTMQKVGRETDVLLITDHAGYAPVQKFIQQDRVSGRKYFVVVINNRFETGNALRNALWRLCCEGALQCLWSLVSAVRKLKARFGTQSNLEDMLDKHQIKSQERKGIIYFNTDIALNEKNLIKNLKKDLSVNFRRYR